eukprot:GDKJ01023641.1.p1 GENE.GDKJ01023641.1~~GDKJ01023641.1.p1  ORF type:complete len:325 (+),score=47.49 GDKJ01023641.1:38-1012(+)
MLALNSQQEPGRFVGEILLGRKSKSMAGLHNTQKSLYGMDSSSTNDTLSTSNGSPRNDFSQPLYNPQPPPAIMSPSKKVKGIRSPTTLPISSDAPHQNLLREATCKFVAQKHFDDIMKLKQGEPITLYKNPSQNFSPLSHLGIHSSALAPSNKEPHMNSTIQQKFDDEEFDTFFEASKTNNSTSQARRASLLGLSNSLNFQTANRKMADQLVSPSRQNSVDVLFSPGGAIGRSMLDPASVKSKSNFQSIFNRDLGHSSVHSNAHNRSQNFGASRKNLTFAPGTQEEIREVMERRILGGELGAQNSFTAKKGGIFSDTYDNVLNR